jgi:hypothetical protein
MLAIPAVGRLLGPDPDGNHAVTRASFVSGWQRARIKRLDLVLITVPYTYSMPENRSALLGEVQGSSRQDADQVRLAGNSCLAEDGFQLIPHG